ncbi:protein FAM47E-like [Dendronephthya gigantea]|uniref:protein FAM47E-like n=1 Tax=Dendronephthya gigantea TaxID=151771 RepID=UPI00106C84E9|nr:protein FAM47E-like [Dendronephthya gigantea]
MAHKYDLLLVNTEREGGKKQIPWYRERLKTKYINPQKSKQCSGTLVGSSWTFVQKGLDDFRDGIPPDIAGNRMVLKGYKGITPNINNSTSEEMQYNLTDKKRFTKDEVVYSKTLPMQQQRRDNVDDIEMSLLQHQLALFPHLEDSVPPEVFEDVVDILDPDLQLGSVEGSDLMEQISCNELDESQTKTSTRRVQSLSPTDTDRKSAQDYHKNRYRWLPKADETPKEEKGRSNRKKIETPNLDDKIQNVTKEFCSWVESLGGDSNNIEESTVMSLFASGYETKPTLSVPIHVVELTNVPPELRVNASASASPLQQNVDINETEKQTRTSYTPSWVKVKYGAWYLNPKTWKKQKDGESLEDPKKQQENTLSEAKIESEKLDNELATLHGARAFKCFVDKKGTRKPEFLSVVEKFQEDRRASVDPRPAAVATPAATANTLPSVAIRTPSPSPTRLV